MKRKTWYPVENGKAVIEIQADSLSQLFDKRDPTPFRLKDLDDDAVEYIVSSAQEIGPSKVGKLKIVTKDPFDEAAAAVIESAVRDYFRYRMDISGKILHSTLKVGFKALLIGVAFLGLSVFLSLSLGSALKNDLFWGHFAKEGLLLLGWVSMWKPANIFLYEWWPLADLRKLYRILSAMDFELARDERPNADLFCFKAHSAESKPVNTKDERYKV